MQIWSEPENQDYNQLAVLMLQRKIYFDTKEIGYFLI